MSDISIPTGAMMALYNLKKINADLVSTQNEISTGRIVNGPKDNHMTIKNAIMAVTKSA
jgi:flagellin-like hook-associated protein FlgL